MVNLGTEICICNGLSAGDIAECIKDNNLHSLEALLANENSPVGDKCESCIDEGFNNDGLNLPLVLSMVKKELL